MVHIVVSNPPRSRLMPVVFNDGGTAAEGCPQLDWDSASRAIAIATGLSFSEVSDVLYKLAIKRRPKRRRNGSKPRPSMWQMRKKPIREYLLSLGWKWVPLIAIGQSHRAKLRSDELPEGRLIVQLSRRFAAVIDGVLHDIHDSSWRGERCVQGYYTKGSEVER